MAGYSLQMIKLRYTADHFKEILGEAGTVVRLKLNRNKISEGMIVAMKASGTDKLKAQNNAMDMAKLELIDPKQFYVDMGLSDPEGRTEALILFKSNPQMYQAKYVLGLQTPEEIAEWLAKQPAPAPQPEIATPLNPQMSGVPTPQMGQPSMPQVQQPITPQAPTVDNTAQIPTTPPVGAPTGSPRNL